MPSRGWITFKIPDAAAGLSNRQHLVFRPESSIQSPTKIPKKPANRRRSLTFAVHFLTNGNVARLIAIDYGTKRVGLATTDPLQLIASALDMVHARDVVAFLKTYAQREEIEAFVVGMPSRLDGTDTDATPHVRGFIKTLKKAFPDVPVYEHDERFTSVLAQRAMLAGGMSKKDRRDKANVDKISATILLQSFMETRK